MAQDPNANPQKKKMDAEQLARFKEFKDASGIMHRTWPNLKQYIQEIQEFNEELQELREAYLEQKDNKETSIKIKHTVRSIY